jgi:SpoVK/Ycf46/Vps4 family AAA+-type ATPase
VPSSLIYKLEDYIRAGTSSMWVKSYEHEDAIRAIVKMCQENNWEVAWWDLADGLQGTDAVMNTPTVAAARTDKHLHRADGALFPTPGSLYRFIPAIRQDINQANDDDPATMDESELTGPSRVLFIMQNCHREELLKNNSLYIQQISNLSRHGRRREGRYGLIFLSPLVDLPVELERQMVVVDHPLPDKEELLTVFNETVPEEYRQFDEEYRSEIIDAALGLTSEQAESAFSLSIAKCVRAQDEFDNLQVDEPYRTRAIERLQKIDSVVHKLVLDMEADNTFGIRANTHVVWDQKAQVIENNPVLTLHDDPGMTFDKIGGLANIKERAVSLLTPRHTNPRLMPRGFILFGVPGGGKTLFAKAIANETGRILLELDLAGARDKYQGQSYQNTKRAFEMVEAMGRSVLLVNEFADAMAGSKGDGSNDAGVGRQISGLMLNQLEKRNDVFFVGTCNDVDTLPAQMYRAGRLDYMFFFDPPSDEERLKIWEIQAKLYEIDISGIPDKELLKISQNMTGAEIENVCYHHAAEGISLAEAADTTSVVATNPEYDLDKMMDWAEKYCTSVRTNKPYRRSDTSIKTNAGKGKSSRNTSLDTKTRKRRRVKKA